jgi:hypothetical protein
VQDDGSEPPLVIVIEDFEAFDADVLKELISIIRYSSLIKKTWSHVTPHACLFLHMHCCL